jgi:tetratricopeptide (TPR) repeat protein
MPRLLLVFCFICLLAPSAMAYAVPGTPLSGDTDVMSPQALSLLEDGKKQLAYGAYEQALSNFTEAASQTPGNVEVAGWLAKARQRVGALYVSRGLGFLEHKKFQEAENAFNSALQVQPNDPAALRYKRLAGSWPHAELYLSEAQKKLSAGQIDYALFYYRKAYDLVGDPNIKRWIGQIEAGRAKR